VSWPQRPEQPELATEFDKALYLAQIAEAAAQLRDQAAAEGRPIAEDWEYRRHGWEMEKEEAAAEHRLGQAIHDARIAVATSTIERAFRGAEFVRLSAGIIATVYTGIAGLAFVTEKGATLPPRGVVPGVFLGLALVLSTAYAAWLTQPPHVPAPIPHSSAAEFQDRRLNTFVRWASRIALHRAYVLHAAVLSLGAGAVLLPTPFVAVPNTPVWILSAVLLAVIFLVPLWTAPKAASSGS
jgi:hypothetical protein